MGIRNPWWICVLGATLLALAGCSTPTPNPDGWSDPGVHAVDGYWVTEELPCVVGVDWGCGFMLDAALPVVRARQPGAVVERMMTAGWPSMRGPDGRTFTFGGLMTPRLVILDLADGTRLTVGLMCGAASHDGGQVQEGCVPSDQEMFRVGNGALADQAVEGH